MNKKLWLIIFLYILLIITVVSLYLSTKTVTLIFIIVSFFDLTYLMLELTSKNR